jgi:hypothetical protein
LKKVNLRNEQKLKKRNFVVKDTDILHRDECLFCGEFGRSGELWYRYVSCSYWSLLGCSGWDTPKNYTCDLHIKDGKCQVKNIFPQVHRTEVTEK